VTCDWDSDSRAPSKFRIRTIFGFRS
jgi:hypothetical protein